MALVLISLALKEIPVLPCGLFKPRGTHWALLTTAQGSWMVLLPATMH